MADRLTEQVRQALQDREAAGRPPFDRPRNDLSYREAMHGVQTGVAMRLALENPGFTDRLLRALKHLRVGVDSAMVNDAAMTRLLIEKGLFTTEEYLEEVRLEANRELDRLEAELEEQCGKKVTLR